MTLTSNRPWAAKWQYKLNVADVFHDEDKPFEEIRDAVVERIKRAPFYEAEPTTPAMDDLWCLVDELADTDTQSYFDMVWSAFYDWCDVDKRVWVETMNRKIR
jgi:hypothetical protein